MIIKKIDNMRDIGAICCYLPMYIYGNHYLCTMRSGMDEKEN